MEKVGKLDAAKRQLVTAIQLFFEREDSVSIHTLTSAAYQLVYDISQDRGLTSWVRGNPLVRDEKRKEWQRILGESQNFFKHADRDPNRVLDFEPEMTRFSLFDAVSLYRELTPEHFHAGIVYQLWFVVAYDEFLLPGRWKDLVTRLKQKGLDPGQFDHILRLLASADLVLPLLGKGSVIDAARGGKRNDLR
ncbi:MAG: hypothetical protein HY706_20935 [Candidatus Hydrogenedentes bacterium]|nr:hypothetical protein [Candidatus Hydrogenedentota bacterium]